MEWPWSKKVEEKSEILTDLSPTMNFGNVSNHITEQFKGEIEQKTVKFPQELGEVHPFNFKITEGLYKKFGFFTAVVDKYIDYVVGPGFFIESKDERAKKIIEDFMRDVNFDTLLRSWTKEALIKGNGYLEIGGSKKEGVAGLKILNAEYMYVKRDKFGVIEEYNQYKGAFDKFAKEQVIDFKPFQIAHVPFNKVGDCAYGLGIGFPALTDMNYTIQQEQDMHMIMNKKANAPLHAKLGKIDGNTKIIPKPADVVAFGQKLETMNNKQEWATDPLVEFKVIDYGNIGERFEKTLDYDIQMLFYDFQIPAVLMGMAKVPEGLAKVQMDAFQRRIQSIQAELEKIIETQIFSRVLEANGFGPDTDVEFEWGSPSAIEVEGRMTLISDLIKSPTTGFAMRTLLEDELVNLLKLDASEYEELKDEQEKKEKEFEAERPQPIVPGQNKNFPQRPQPKAQQPAQPKPIVPKTTKQLKVFPKSKSTTSVKRAAKGSGDKRISLNPYVVQSYESQKVCPHCSESVSHINSIEEWLGFNYKEYLGYIEEAIQNDSFDLLKAVTEIEKEAGRLTESQILKLKDVLSEGMKKGQGISQMAKNLDKTAGLKDLYQMEDGKLKLGASGLPRLVRTKEKRATMIIRTEVTRVANAGAVEHYKEKGIKRVEWVASFGDRTCPDCEALNGKIYEIGARPDIPLHAMCRCTLAPITELV